MPTVLAPDGALLGWHEAGAGPPLLLLRADGPAVAAELRALLAVPAAAGRDLRGVRSPVLLVQGGRDRLTPPADAAELLALLPDVRALVVPRSGHLVPLRVPTVRGAVRSFPSAGRAPRPSGG